MINYGVPTENLTCSKQDAEICITILISRNTLDFIKKTKWDNELNLNENFGWQYTIKVPFTITTDPNLLCFQYFINH